jgi:proteasome accessory factor B
MKISRIYRLLRVITMLQSGRGYTANELARELEVSRRTVFRDLNMLEMAHIPYYFDADQGGYRISRHFFLPPINLTIAEALAILLLAGRMRSTSKLPLLSHGAKAAVKVESALPRTIREHVASIMERLSVRLSPVARHEGLDATFDDLANAIGTRRVCRLAYASFHEEKQIVTTAHPFRLVFVGRAWYFVAYSSRHREIRTFKLTRVKKLTVTGRQFTWPEGIDLDEYFGGAWCMIPEGKVHEVHLRFSPKVAGNVAEVQWHDTQRLEWNDDGSAEYHVHVDGLGEITWWILGYGDQVEVVAPRQLRKEVANVAARVLSKYK